MRTFVFGIDGLTMRIMRPLMEKGIVPNFKRIYENSSRGVLKSTLPPLTPPGWASIYSGKNPGKHGLFEFTRREGYEIVSNMCWDYSEAPPLWKYLSDHGKKSVLLNIPMYYPPLKLKDCVSVSGFNAIENLDVFHPEALRKEFQENIPGYKIDSYWKHDLPEDKRDAYIKDNMDLTLARLEALKYLMKEKPWDFFFVVFTGTDRMQHFFWDEIINGVPEIVQYYTLLDEAIGYVVDSLEKDDVFMIVSDHGFRPIQKNVNLNAVLQQHGLLSLKRSVELPLNYMKFRKVIENWGMIKKLKRVVPQWIIDKLHEHSKIEGSFSFKKINWQHTEAFASSGTYGGMSINLKGREPDGIVDESEYNRVRNRIIEIFSSLEEDGRKVVRSVHKREDIYSGKHLRNMPDLVLLSETDYRFEGSLDSGGIFREPRHSDDYHIMNGEHEVETLFIFRHAEIKKEFNEVSVTDIAPSILNLYGIPIPTSMDGKSLFNDIKKTLYIDESTGAVFDKQDKKSLNVKLKLKKLFD